jgi:protein-tyrosine-phosphatase
MPEFSRSRVLNMGLAGTLVIFLCIYSFPHVAWAASQTTAWKNGKFNVDVANVVRQSNIVLSTPNMTGIESMPLGNGRLGSAVWSASGLTAQLNRVDTFPTRKSPGQVVIPGLAKLTGSSDYKGSVDLYDAMMRESGGGMSASIYILQNKDELVIDVTGADPTSTQTAQVKLWSGRSPTAAANGPIATLAETWVDNSGNGASGQTFGSLAAITAGGRNVKASVVDPLTIQVSFNPNPDGTFRIIVAAPSWRGGNAQATAASLIGLDAIAPPTILQNKHLNWWHRYWGRVGLIKMTSDDGNAQYIENLRDIDLYTVAAYSGGELPGSHAGVADLFAWNQDTERWFPAGYWHWNLRMQVAANLGAGNAALNAPYFNLYSGNLSNIEAWTKQQIGGDGTDICIPETMRFNGNGYYLPPRDVSNASCDANIAASYNARTLSTGAEVGLWIWQQYLYTGDRNFLSTNYPTMAAAARFLLNYAKQGSDGKLHTSPSNAHETQWDVADPTTDIAAMQALFPVVIQAATLLRRDPALVATLKSAQSELLPFPRTDIATQTQLLSPGDDAQGQDMIALSYEPTAKRHNTENLGLEPVWPYNLIGDNQGTLTQLAQRTFTNRSYVVQNDWSNDPIQAARLDLSSDFQSTVAGLPQKYQVYPSGMGSVFGNTSSDPSPYGEMVGVIATATQEALVQDYDGLLRIAPAWPSGWDGSGTVYIQGNSKVDVQVESGKLVTAVIEVGSSGNINVRNPWSGQAVQVVDEHGIRIVPPTTANQFTIPVIFGHSYLIEPVSNPTTSLPFAQVTDQPANVAKSLGSRKIGL